MRAEKEGWIGGHSRVVIWNGLGLYSISSICCCRVRGWVWIFGRSELGGLGLVNFRNLGIFSSRVGGAWDRLWKEAGTVGSGWCVYCLVAVIR